jgi:hypothetical protein
VAAERLATPAQLSAFKKERDTALYHGGESMAIQNDVFGGEIEGPLQ